MPFSETTIHPQVLQGMITVIRRELTLTDRRIPATEPGPRKTQFLERDELARDAINALEDLLEHIISGHTPHRNGKPFAHEYKSDAPAEDKAKPDPVQAVKDEIKESIKNAIYELESIEHKLHHWPENQKHTEKYQKLCGQYKNAVKALELLAIKRVFANLGLHNLF